MHQDLSAVVIREGGLRETLQSVARALPAVRRLERIRDVHDAGQREIEVGSFVPARLPAQPTGLDFGRLIGLRAKVAGCLEGEALHGALARAGLPGTMEPA